MIAEHSLIELRQALAKLEPHERTSVAWAGNGISLHTVPAEQMIRAREMLAELLRTIESVCSAEPADIEHTDMRAKLRVILGQAATETLLLAAKGKRVLWTDDGVLAAVGRSELKIRRAWTQTVFFWLAELRKVSGSVQGTVSYRLLQMKYRYTGVNLNTVLAAGEAVSWDLDADPLKRVLDQFSGNGTEPGSALRVFIIVAKAVWQGGLMERQARAVIWRLLDRIGSWPGGVHAVRAMTGMLERLFQGDSRTTKRAEKLFHQWLEGKQ